MYTNTNDALPVVMHLKYMIIPDYTLYTDYTLLTKEQDIVVHFDLLYAVQSTLDTSRI